MYQHLYNLLTDLDGVLQDPRYHPEEDALYHSLQVFERALEGTEDVELHVAALLHDIGKSTSTEGHAATGAQLLEGLFGPRVVGLVRHHMDLHHNPRQTRALLRGTRVLADLELLRSFDVAGRDPYARVMSPEQAVEICLEYQSLTLEPGDDVVRWPGAAALADLEGRWLNPNARRRARPRYKEDV